MTYQSEQKRLRKRYPKDLPRYCLGCGSLVFTLFHLTYDRLGKEVRGDLVPLCPVCAGCVRGYFDRHYTSMKKMREALVGALRWTPSEVKEKLGPFSRG